MFNLEVENLTIKSESKVIYERYYTVSQNGNERGSVDVTFDFSKLPEKHHEMILTIIQQTNGFDICLPSIKLPHKKNDPLKKKSFWRRFLPF